MAPSHISHLMLIYEFPISQIINSNMMYPLYLYLQSYIYMINLINKSIKLFKLLVQLN